jgi:hypothetical protein
MNLEYFFDLVFFFCFFFCKKINVMFSCLQLIEYGRAEAGEYLKQPGVFLKIVCIRFNLC